MLGSKQRDFSRVLFIFTCGAILFATIWALAPLLRAKFYLDDYWLLFLGRHSDNPLHFWTEDHSKFYFYRPFGVTVWWLSAFFFSTNESAHYTLNIVLHLLVAFAFALWVNQLFKSRWLALAAGAVYALHPTAARTSAWLSDRFDLLASASVFLALFAFERGRTHRLWLVCFAVATVVAFSSKESGLVLLAPVAVQTIWAWKEYHRAPRYEISALAIAILAVVLFLTVRQTLLWVAGPPVGQSGYLGAITSGSVVYIRDLPAALLGYKSWPHFYLATGFVVFLAASRVALQSSEATRDRIRTFIVGTSLLCATIVVHAPLAPYNPQPVSLAEPSAAPRLFHIALGAVFVLVASMIRGDMTATFKIFHRAQVAAFVGAIVAWGFASHQVARVWQHRTASDTAAILPRVLESVRTVGATSGSQKPCVFVILGTPAEHLNFRQASDVMLKAYFSPTEPLLRCAFVTEISPFVVFTPAALCSAGYWQPMMDVRDKAYPRAFSNLCYHALNTPAVPPKTSAMDIVRLKLTDSGRFVRIP